MGAKDIRSLTTSQMLGKEKRYKEELFSLRFQQTTGQLESITHLRQVRKDIARIETVLSEEVLK